MKKPNFFIIGAPKCATTSLASWLSAHPQIFMSARKEPNHFNTDHQRRMTPERADYEWLFNDAGEQHKAVGEATVWYLYSREAIGHIEQYSPNARYIVCLRNPVEMAYSLYGQAVISGSEPIASFEEAWAACEQRKRGENVSRWATDPSFQVYSEVCLLGEQMERLYAQVPKERVLPVLLDDFKADAAGTYRRVLQFLQVDDDGRSDFSAKNTAKRIRFPWLHQLIIILGYFKRWLGLRRDFGLLDKIMGRTTQTYKPAPLSPQMRQVLQDAFRADIEKLSRLLERDLSHWLQ